MMKRAQVRGGVVALAACVLACQLHAATYDIKSYGAVGDGKTLDTAAINKAIETAAAAGGGTVFFPAGIYASHSIRLKSNITLHLDQGATLLAAPAEPNVGYDPAEPNPWGDERRYQDFGHSHWHNSLIWGENLENISIIGAGKIDGTKGLTRGENTRPNGANKAIALKLCRNVIIRDLTFLMCGHF
jgi:polygalacturonase